MAIKLIVGLGNPGKDYQMHRHNVGFWLIDSLANSYNGIWKNDNKFFADTCKITIDNKEIILLKPCTYMNKSGKVVASFCNFFKITTQQMLVAHDELDFPIEDIRIKYSGGHGGHNGLRDIISCLDNNFYRLRIGIGRPNNRLVSDFVLNNPNKTEQQIIINNIISAIQVMPKIVNNQIDDAIQILHSKE